MEEWRGIPGFEGLYQASSLGRVRSVDRTIERACRWGGTAVFKYKGRVLRDGAGSNGYRVVQLGAGQCKSVHRLVAKAFIPGGGDMQVNHKNGVRLDNRVENLEWLTCGDNHRHSYQNLPRKKHALTRSVHVQGWGHDFPSVVEAAHHLGVTPGAVSSAALNGHRCKGFEVRYV